MPMPPPIPLSCDGCIYCCGSQVESTSSSTKGGSSRANRSAIEHDARLKSRTWLMNCRTSGQSRIHCSRLSEACMENVELGCIGRIHQSGFAIHSISNFAEYLARMLSRKVQLPEMPQTTVNGCQKFRRRCQFSGLQYETSGSLCPCLRATKEGVASAIWNRISIQACRYRALLVLQSGRLERGHMHFVRLLSQGSFEDAQQL